MPVLPTQHRAAGRATPLRQTAAMAVPDDPCTRCGACCASFRVDFAREELDEHGGSVPAGLAVDVSESVVRLRGTDHARPRCVALVGTVGQAAHCAIHPWRPSPCREFGLRAPFGIGDEACDRARARHGLPPLDGPVRAG
jgi:Fe-S-cluster containining protein